MRIVRVRKSSDESNRMKTHLMCAWPNYVDFVVCTLCSYFSAPAVVALIGIRDGDWVVIMFVFIFNIS